MKYRLAWVLATILIAVTSCGEDSTRSVTPGTIVASVVWAGKGVPDKQIDIVETGATHATDSEGLSLFSVPPGTYTVRAHDIGTPGPGLPFVDREVSVGAGEEVQVEFFDCRDCD